MPSHYGICFDKTLRSFDVSYSVALLYIGVHLPKCSFSGLSRGLNIRGWWGAKNNIENLILEEPAESIMGLSSASLDTRPSKWWLCYGYINEQDENINKKSDVM